MRPPADRTPFHCVRSAMLATAAVTLAAGAHVLAGGHLPAPGILLGLLALISLAATAATRLRLNSATMTALLGAGQLVLHEAFSVFGSAFTPAASGAAKGSHHAAPFTAPLAAGPAELHIPDSQLTVAMLAGHALATIACALLLAKGEDALWSLAAWLRPLVQLPAPVTPDAVASPAVAIWPAEAAPLPWRNLRFDCRRGPPSAVVLS
ncbi:hypothetical protein QFZ79_000552 [Arthrobacter sp. V4I6]|uniref:hypothetical protein n=1 Tax=unclassified Arthrobacter TaxID=235627 RepID=UPI00278825A1|nr:MULTISPECIES: hypothetical protein [unclassified Arthrobacter]MDQ0822812.1 hypothetical protein [Arthrobacter sp. V1I7]MDQ0852441.1 hypothetical protein [Arthrobacter sp. V4I6]